MSSGSILFTFVLQSTFLSSNCIHCDIIVVVVFVLFSVHSTSIACLPVLGEGFLLCRSCKDCKAPWGKLRFVILGYLNKNWLDLTWISFTAYIVKLRQCFFQSQEKNHYLSLHYFVGLHVMLEKPRSGLRHLLLGCQLSRHQALSHALTLPTQILPNKTKPPSWEKIQLYRLNRLYLHTGQSLNIRLLFYTFQHWHWSINITKGAKDLS